MNKLLRWLWPGEQKYISSVLLRIDHLNLNVLACSSLFECTVLLSKLNIRGRLSIDVALHRNLYSSWSPKALLTSVRSIGSCVIELCTEPP